MAETPTPYVYRAQVLSVYDGDTITVMIDLGLRIKVRASCRMLGIDTPEIRGKTATEKKMALVARDRLREMVLGTEVTLHSIAKPDKYGRLLVRVWSDEHGYVNGVLLDEGLARAYDGGTRQPWG